MEKVIWEPVGAGRPLEEKAAEAKFNIATHSSTSVLLLKTKSIKLKGDSHLVWKRYSPKLAVLSRKMCCLFRYSGAASAKAWCRRMELLNVSNLE